MQEISLDSTLVRSTTKCRAFYSIHLILFSNSENISVREIERGMVASSPSNMPVVPAETFTAQIIILQHPGHLAQGYTPVFFCHTASFPGTWIELIRKVDPKTGVTVEEKPKIVKAGDHVVVKIKPNKPVAVEPYKNFPAFGRFAIRDNRMTIGVGVVLSVEASTKALAGNKSSTTTTAAKSKYFKK